MRGFARQKRQPRMGGQTGPPTGSKQLASEGRGGASTAVKHDTIAAPASTQLPHL